MAAKPCCSLNIWYRLENVAKVTSPDPWTGSGDKVAIGDGASSIAFANRCALVRQRVNVPHSSFAATVLPPRDSHLSRGNGKFRQGG
jgi:hypothetical protein